MSRLAGLFERFRASKAASNEAQTECSEIRWVIMGLGNPGARYRRSRHNLGFMAVQQLTQRHDSAMSRRKFNGRYAEIRTGAGNAIVIMPQTFYNRSGDCASAMLGYYKVPAERLIVVHDDIDLPEGQIRLKRGGGDAGNRGVRSIAEALATPDFNRVRIGVAHPGAGQGAVEHVIQPLTSEEMRSFGPVIHRAADAVLAIMRDGLDRARSLYNQRV